jgi:hypothetical protein
MKKEGVTNENPKSFGAHIPDFPFAMPFLLGNSWSPED